MIYGNSYIRCLLVQGAYSVLIAATKRQKANLTPKNNLTSWALKILNAKKKQQAAIAVANKIARIIWAVLAKEAEYDANIAAQGSAV